jgi:hypothetical protein
LQDPDQSTGEADFSSKRQALTMLKHRCAALLIFTMSKHRCAAMLIFMMPKHRCAAMLIFTMLKHRCAALLIFPMLKHHCLALFISSHFLKHSSPPFPHHFSFPKQLRPALVSPFSLLLLKHHYQQFFIFPLSVAETPLPATFHHFSRC